MKDFKKIMGKDIKKYYVPDITEFHIGFEYEYEDINEGGASMSWYKGILQPNEAYIIDQIHNDENREYRVKYLDREDIESLGFSFKTVYGRYDLIFDIENEYELIYTPSNNWLMISKYYDTGELIRSFYGVIKNKSELKKLLKQLNIT